ncbi:hypothetical protein U27_01272 [Candidatus Vecturithrix granuli]|uniref:Membrane-anchored protein n=1 Tax=Vecturithrix granuli TaxID=1499967 RepID=A0A081C9W7_VECG1|nr:hypothetical protein U27_01272 [Candidatus Vecturithrix granuli]
MRNALLWITALLVLAVVNVQIVQKERLLQQGITMLLRLAPVDPRSLIQGDYMALRYDLPEFLREHSLPRDGHVVVRLDEQQVATILRLHRPEAPPGPGEHLLRYRRREGSVQLGSKAFFFQEGHADYYANARYGELRVNNSGESVLVGLRDNDLHPLGPSQQK